MKKIVLFLVLSLFSLMAFGQSIQKQQYNEMTDIYQIMSMTKIHVDKTGAMYDWRLSNPPCNGCGSFYYAITRTTEVDEEGKYWFYLIMQSNSVYGNGTWATSYIQDINVHVILSDGEDVHVLGPFYSLVQPPQTENDKSERYITSIWSEEPDIVINVSWGSVQAY